MAYVAKAAVFFFLAVGAAAVISCHAARSGAAIAAGGCQLSDITVTTARTGKVVEGQPEYEVTVANGCACPQNGIRVSCPGGVQSVEPVDESKIRAEDLGLCLVNDGMPVANGSPVTFTYAWAQPQDFAAAQATPWCS
ncbi:TPD1 protein homolog 1-like [Oryza brachyantha]|uniref:Uncharacterized protein n=1 Tax=Oryza brachyantha TaxID=4533 RepID=J3MFX1_ORYBR|nr:TPD1 protein homolog 1-like [Oryza brachyantha]